MKAEKETPTASLPAKVGDVVEALNSSGTLSQKFADNKSFDAACIGGAA